MPEQKDILSVDLDATDKGSAKVENFKGNVKSAADDINAFGKHLTFGDDIGKQLVESSRRADGLRTGIASAAAEAAKLNSPVWKTYATGAKFAADEAKRVHNNLISIRAEMAKATTPAALASLQKQAAAANAELDKLERKVKRVTEGRAAAAQRTAGPNLGKLSGIADLAAMLGVPHAAEIGAGIDAAAVAGIGASSLAVFGGIAAAGAILVHISKDIRTEAERRLKTEETIASVVNKQIIDQQKQLSDLQKVRDDAAQSFELKGTLAGAGGMTDGAIKARIALLDQLRNGTADEGNRKRFNDEAAGLENILRNRPGEKTAAADKAFNESNEAFKRSQESARKEAEKFAESVQKGFEKAIEFGDKSKELFSDLFARSGSNNPFVAVYNDAAKAIDETRKATFGLSADLRNQAEVLTQRFNAGKLFDVRLQSALTSSDLRADANGFRNPFDPKAQTAQFDAIMRRHLGAAIGTDKDGRPIFDGTGRNVEAITEFANRFQRVAGAGRGPETVAERIERQLDVIDKLRPNSDAERAAAERALIQLTQGINPNDLTDRGRNAAAAARENEAARTDQAEANALQLQVARDETFGRIDKNIAALLEKAQSEGLAGVIRIIDDTSNRVAITAGNRPNPSDSAAMMQ